MINHVKRLRRHVAPPYTTARSYPDTTVTNFLCQCRIFVFQMLPVKPKGLEPETDWVSKQPNMFHLFKAISFEWFANNCNVNITLFVHISFGNGAENKERRDRHPLIPKDFLVLSRQGKGIISLHVCNNGPMSRSVFSSHSQAFSCVAFVRNHSSSP